MMSVQIIAAAVPQAAINTQGLVSYLQSLFGPLFLGIVGIVALFFLFTREITRFVQFIVLAVAIAVIFYTPGIVQTSNLAPRRAVLWTCPLIRISGG
jgi:hypothetical protein